LKKDGINVTTKAGNESLEIIPLNRPSGIILNAENNLFIMDCDNHRIVRLRLNVLGCLVGCSNTTRLTSYQLFHSVTLSFDIYENIFITDQDK